MLYRLERSARRRRRRRRVAITRTEEFFLRINDSPRVRLIQLEMRSDSYWPTNIDTFPLTSSFKGYSALKCYFSDTFEIFFQRNHRTCSVGFLAYISVNDMMENNDDMMENIDHSFQVKIMKIMWVVLRSLLKKLF